MLTDMSIAIPVDFRILADFLIFAPDFRVGKGKITPWLTAEYIRGRIIRRKSASCRPHNRGCAVVRKWQRLYRIREPKSSLKKVEKLLKKVLTKEKESGIIDELSQRAVADGH